MDFNKFFRSRANPEPQSRNEPAPVPRPPSPVSPVVDAMSEAQRRLAEKRRAMQNGDLSGTAIVVRGLSRYGWDGFRDEFTPGAEVYFEREPSNSYDPNAVKVFIKSTGRHLGYVAKEQAAILTKKLQTTWEYRAVVSDAPYVSDKFGQCFLRIGENGTPLGF